MKINDYTFEEAQNALGKAFEIMNPAEETNAERLADIKERFSKMIITYGRSNGKTQFANDVNFLFEQAERAQELEGLLKDYQTDFGILVPENKRLRKKYIETKNALNDEEQENERLRYELQKIADIQLLDGRGRLRYQELLVVSVLTARQALEGAGYDKT